MLGSDGDAESAVRPQRALRINAYGLGIAFLVALTASIRHGHGSTLPAIALGWPLLLYFERAGILLGICVVVLTFIVRLAWGQLPSELSTTGIKWAEKAASALIAPEREARRAAQQAIRDLQAVVDPAAAGSGFATVSRDENGSHSEKGMRNPGVGGSIREAAISTDVASGRGALADAVQALPERQRLVYALSQYEHLPDRDIAEILGISLRGVIALRKAAKDAVETAVARAWLQRISDIYAGMDLGGTDPVHAVRMNAQAMLADGPTLEDASRISAELADALPGDPRAGAFAKSWQDELDRLEGHI